MLVAGVLSPVPWVAKESILRFGACGRKVLVSYSGLQARSIRYSCSTNCRHDDGKRCLAFTANTPERALTDQLLETVSPLGVEAAARSLVETRSH